MYDKEKVQQIAGAKEQWENGMVAKTLAKNKERRRIRNNIGSNN